LCFLSLTLYLIQNQIKLSAPVILPSKGLPYLSFQNRLKTSPKDYTALFDLAAAGPITGLAVSFLALLLGLQLTTTVDSSTAQLLPSLSVGFLCQSSLGGTLVDTILGGGDGILINQEVGTQVPLHPVAIAGFLGMLINALDLLPIGSTDGGRMSQAALGRVWHLTFSSVVFFVLFFATFVSDAQDIFLGYLFLSSFTQRDLEIPCRNEVDKVELPRVIAAVISWGIAALVLVPLR
jgi:membrane-associated protease RseP (regulator of RpoE activity)